MKVERQYESIWRAAGNESFDQFLRSNCGPEYRKYCAFVQGVEKAGEEAAKHNGAAWTILAGESRDPRPEVLVEFRRRGELFVEEHNVAPTRQTAKKWLDSLEDRGCVSESHACKVTELQRLRAENAQLKAANERLQAELAAAQARIRDLNRRRAA